MTNIKNFSIVKIVDFVPECGIWREVKFVRCADAMCNFGILEIS
jgi:hypothetical protein